MKSQNIRKLTTISMLAAAAFIAVFFVRIPIMPAVPFLKYEPKDVIITIGGLIYGPLSAMTISLIVSFVELITISDTGIIGFVMNVISSCSFACVASAVYKKKHTMSGAVLGLSMGIVVMVCAMLLWNYLITPLYMNITREAVVGLLYTAFLPFNLLKGILNMAFSLVLYKPVISALRKTGAVPPRSEITENKKAMGAILGGFIAITVVILLLVLIK